MSGSTLQRKTPMQRGSQGLARSSFKKKDGAFSSFSSKGASSKPTREKCAVAVPSSATDDREQRLEARAARAAQQAIENIKAGVRVGVAPVFSELVTSVPKGEYLRSPAYRELVASFPCMFCGRANYSQFAHGNQGKGKGLKTCDTTGFPLCAVDLLDEGCHVRFDQYRLFASKQAHAKHAREWGAQIRAKVKAMGKWPKAWDHYKEPN